MSGDNRKKLNRRSVVTALGGSGILGLAGCMSQSGSDDTPEGSSGDSSGGQGDQSDTDTPGSSSDFPSEDITVLMTKGEGGATDVYTRNLIGPAIERLGVNAQYEYVTGSGGLRGLSLLQQRGADGHTICSFNIAGGIFSYLINQPDYDITDFKPVSTTSVGAFTMFTHPNHEDMSTMDDVLQKYENGDWGVIAGQGNGDATNALILKMAQSEEYGLSYDRYTQYGGTAPTAQALSREEIPIMVGSDGGARSYYRNGDIKAIAALRSDGSPIFPEIPTITDQGYSTWDYLATVRRGFVMHPDTPSEYQETLSQAVQEAANSEEVQQWEEESGMPITYMDHEEYGSMIEEGVEKVPEVIDVAQFRE